jgi:hypothetical protein
MIRSRPHRPSPSACSTPFAERGFLLAPFFIIDFVASEVGSSAHIEDGSSGGACPGTRVTRALGLMNGGSPVQSSTIRRFWAPPFGGHKPHRPRSARRLTGVRGDGGEDGSVRLAARAGAGSAARAGVAGRLPARSRGSVAAISHRSSAEGHPLVGWRRMAPGRNREIRPGASGAGGP